MEVKNCRECGRLFNYIGGQRVCPSCREKLEDKFQQVKKYIEEHRSAQMQEISEENDVTIQQIKQWVREERLAFTNDSIVGIECESCGCTIKTGRFCDACKKQMVNTFGNAIRKEPKKEPTREARNNRTKERMRFLDSQ